MKPPRPTDGVARHCWGKRRRIAKKTEKGLWKSETEEDRMKMDKIGAKWLRKNSACTEGYAWAIAECANLREVWDTARPDWLVWVATRPGVLDDRTLWEFATQCAEQALPHWVAAYPDDKRPQQAIEARRGWLRGEVSDEALSAAALAAESAAWSAWSAAESALSAAESAESAAWSEAWSAEWSAESAAESAAARSAALAAQAQWLRDNATPRFPDYIAQLAQKEGGAT